jgi:putative exporter of polyketide antibiotics
MKMISPRTAILTLMLIMASAYCYDFGLFQTLLGWLLGGIIVQLVTIAVFGNIIANVMKNKDVQEIVKAAREEIPDFKKLLKELLHYIKQILENQKNSHRPE